jgi:hypothetical protein
MNLRTPPLSKAQRLGMIRTNPGRLLPLRAARNFDYVQSLHAFISATASAWLMQAVLRIQLGRGPGEQEHHVGTLTGPSTNFGRPRPLFVHRVTRPEVLVLAPSRGGRDERPATPRLRWPGTSAPAPARPAQLPAGAGAF